MFHHSFEYLDVGDTIRSGNWGRIVQGYGGQHGLFAREALWEHIRATEYADLPSRLDCSYAYDDVGHAGPTRQWYAQDKGRWPGLYEVEPIGAPITHRAPLDAVEDFRTLHRPAQLVDVARSYWSGATAGVRAEVLVAGNLRVVGVIERGRPF